MRILMALVLVCVGCVEAQQKPLRNQDVIAMVQAGISDSLIIKRIGGQKNEFDLSSAGLIELKRNGASESVIAAMMGIAPPPAPSPAAQASTAAGARPLPTAPPTWREPEAFGIFVENGSELSPLARSQRQLTANKKRTVLTAGGALGALGVHSKSFTRLPGLRSTQRLSPQASFVVHLSEARFPNVKLVRVAMKETDREVAVSSKVYSTETKEDNGVDVEVVKIKPEIYRVRPRAPLEPAEYAFVDTTPYNQASVLVYDFGVN